MDDHEIQSTVESILGPGVKVVDCEKKSSMREEEVLLINGVPIPLEGPDGVAIREAMITGQVPPCDLLNQILVKAGILRAPVRLETSLSVKSSIVTKEEVTVARGGKVVDERSRETKENNYYASSTSEIWEPVGIIHRPRNIKPFDSSDESRPNSNASSDQGYTTNTSSNHVLREASGSSTVGCPICEDNDPDCARRCLGGLTGLGTKVPVQTTNSAVSDSQFCFAVILVIKGPFFWGIIRRMLGRIAKFQEHDFSLILRKNCPTIFGTVASDLNPKDGNSRRVSV
ncbi:hypothetical protein ANTQUA_LOCUS428, partial [Anthophora quadrimaculata]